MAFNESTTSGEPAINAAEKIAEATTFADLPNLNDALKIVGSVEPQEMQNALALLSEAVSKKAAEIMQKLAFELAERIAGCRDFTTLNSPDGFVAAIEAAVTYGLPTEEIKKLTDLVFVARADKQGILVLNFAHEAAQRGLSGYQLMQECNQAGMTFQQAAEVDVLVRKYGVGQEV